MPRRYDPARYAAKRKRNHGRATPRWRRIIAIDGEGKNDEIDAAHVIELCAELLDCWERLEGETDREIGLRGRSTTARRALRIESSRFERGARNIDGRARDGRQVSSETRRMARLFDDCERAERQLDDALATAHRNTLLCSSDGRHIAGDDLSTRDVLDFLLGCDPRGLVVGFSVGYDVNMWLRDLPADKLAKLHRNGHVWWSGYKLTWHVGKRFTVARGRVMHAVAHKDGTMGTRWAWSQRTTVYDVFGFFQSSFVAACRAWDIGSPDVLDRIDRMKAQRGDFAHVDDAAIRAYCFEECEILVALVTRLIETCHSVGIRLQSYHGAGAGAAAWLSAHHIRDYMAPPPKPVFDAALMGYFGGWFEAPVIGPIGGDVYVDDICSAYPSEIVKLPCLAHGAWMRTQRVHDHGIYHARWMVPAGVRWGPLPWRYPDGGICRPLSGEGWYWGAEIAAALRLYPGRIHVIDGWRLVTECEHVPFAAVRDDYARRLELKRAGDHGALVLKLILNSLYGKMAQTVGGGKVAPPYLSFVWAGMVTAGTRARILDAVRQDPDAVLSIATDGILTSRPLTLDRGDALGQWESSQARDLFIAQNGVYRYTHVGGAKDGKVKTASRGFSGRELDFDGIAAVFASDRGGSWSRKVRRFNGLGLSLHRTPTLHGWRRWTWHRKTVSLLPGNRLTAYELGRDTGAGPMLTFPHPGADGISSPRVLSTAWSALWRDDPERAELLDQPASV